MNHSPIYLALAIIVAFAALIWLSIRHGKLKGKLETAEELLENKDEFTKIQNDVAGDSVATKRDKLRRNRADSDSGGSGGK